MGEGKHFFDASSALLAHIQSAFAQPGILLQSPGTLRVDAYFSSPRTDAELFGLAHAAGPPGPPLRPLMEELLVTGSWKQGEDGRPTLIYALSCYVYTLPQHRAGVVYVSKLDTTGYAPAALQGPTQEICQEWGRTRTTIAKLLTESVLSYFVQVRHWQPASPDRPSAVDHVSLHVLARAQHAYIFPRSDKSSGKHILSDKQLIRWWRSVLSNVITGAGARAFYLIPGFSALESTEVLPLPQPEAGWQYGEPYTRPYPREGGNPLPLYHPGILLDLYPPDRHGRRPASLAELAEMDPSIAALVPTFDDDPKGRFLSELVEEAYDQGSGIKVGRKRRARTPAEEVGIKRPKLPQDTDEGVADQPQPRDASPSVGENLPEEAKEDVPLPEANAGITPPATAQAASDAPALTPAQKEAWKERAQLDRVSPAEFWERMGFRQECNSGNAVGVFTVLVQRPTSSTGSPPRETLREGKEATWRTALGALPGNLLHDLIIRLLLLDKNDWSTADSAAELTHRWIQTLGGMVRRKGEAPRSFRFPGEQPMENQAADDQATEQERKLESLTFTLIPLAPPPTDVVERAQKAHQRKQEENSAQPSAASAPRMLTVKRKKKTTT